MKKYDQAKFFVLKQQKQKGNRKKTLETEITTGGLRKLYEKLQQDLDRQEQRDKNRRGKEGQRTRREGKKSDREEKII